MSDQMLGEASTNGIALPKGSTLRPAVDKALTTMVEDGTIARLQRKLLTCDLAKLPILA